jgi:hypothetical protein
MDEIEYQKLLVTRICDLDLNLQESMGPYFQRLKNELRSKRILLWPDFYFGNEWGCVNKKISISIPFYFGRPELKVLEGDETTIEQMMKILRHETGHAVNYAYRLWREKEWREAFGDFNKAYPKDYKVNPWSRSFVRHLHYLGDPHYAQKHPDEDWAETFAIWLDPRSHWVTKYRRWPHALEKLSCVDQLMGQIAGREPPDRKRKQHGTYGTVEETISEWWGLDGEMLDQELQEYLHDMNELFGMPMNGKKKLIPAAKLIRKSARLLTDHVSLWICGSNKHTVRKCLRRWEAICENESLGYLPEEEERKLVELTALLTYYVVDWVHHIRS